MDFWFMLKLCRTSRHSAHVFLTFPQLFAAVIRRDFFFGVLVRVRQAAVTKRPNNNWEDRSLILSPIKRWIFQVSGSSVHTDIQGPRFLLWCASVDPQPWGQKSSLGFHGDTPVLGSSLELSPSLCSHSIGENLAPRSQLTVREAA